MITSKSPHNLYALRSPINDKTTYKIPPLLLDAPGKPDHQVTDPTANLGPPSRASVSHFPDVNHCVWYLFDSKVTGSLGVSQDPSDSESSASTHFSMSLAHKDINLKEPYKQDIKEQVTTKTFLKQKTGLHEIPNTRGIVCRRCFKAQSPICGVNFSNNTSITKVRVNERKTNLTRPLKPLNH